MSEASDARDAVTAAKAGCDQLHAVYRHVWIPFYRDVAHDMDEAGMRPELVDGLVQDLHRRMVQMSNAFPD